MEPNQIIHAIEAFNTVYQFLKNIKEILDKSEKGGWKWKLFGSKKTERMERKFKEALIGTKNAIEYYVWYGKGFAILDKCNSKVDGSFHHLMGRIINAFSDIDMRLDSKKLDEKLVDHLIRQLKILENNARFFWNIQGISSHREPDKDAMKIIADFQSALSGFQASMEPYLKPQT